MMFLLNFLKLTSAQFSMDYYVYTCLITLLITIILYLTIYTWKKRNRKECKIFGKDILRVLKNIKILPISYATDWKLHSYKYPFRTWINVIEDKENLPYKLSVYGCFSKMKGNSMSILSLLKERRLIKEWRPGIINTKVLKKAQDIEKYKTSHLLSIFHEMLNVVTDAPINPVLSIVNDVSQRIQGKPLLQKVQRKHRYWNREENNCCWFLEFCDDTESWMYYIIQPVEGFFEGDQCIVTLICYAPPSQIADVSSLPSIYLGSFIDFMTFKKVNVSSFVNISSSLTCENKPPSIADDDEENEPIQIKDENMKSDTGIVKRFRKMIEEKKELYEERKRNRNSASSSKSVNSDKNEVASSILQHTKKNSVVYYDSDIEEIDIDAGSLLEVDNFSEECTSINSEHDEYINTDEHVKLDEIQSETSSNSDSIERHSVLKELRCASITSLNSDSEILTASDAHDEDISYEGLARLFGSQESLISISETSEVDSCSKIPNGRKTFAQRLLSQIRKFEKNHSKSEIEENQYEEEIVVIDENDIPKNPELSELEVHRSIAESVAKELLKEKTSIAKLDITRPFNEQSIATGGWVYCGLEKDVVILRKLFDDGTPYQCYLGKGLIAAPPKVVFDAVKNPQTRFKYDEMLKKIDVIHDFGNGMRIVHLYHEVSQLFRKETRDFCVLQCEQIEGVKYIISMRSVVWNGCEENSDIIRGHFLPSGWIIEPVTKDEKLFSMVTYIVQLELGISKTNTGYMVEELAAKQPLSIANLRYYLVPSSTNSRPTVSSFNNPRGNSLQSSEEHDRKRSGSLPGTNDLIQMKIPLDNLSSHSCKSIQSNSSSSSGTKTSSSHPHKLNRSKTLPLIEGNVVLAALAKDNLQQNHSVNTRIDDDTVLII